MLKCIHLINWPKAKILMDYLMTLDNGYLGSRIDEERSEMRYLVWIAESREPSSLWTQVAPKAFRWKACLLGRHIMLISFTCLNICKESENDLLFAWTCSGLKFILHVRYMAWWVEFFRMFTILKMRVMILCRLMQMKITLGCLIFLNTMILIATPSQARLPAEFKHINKRRRRNLQEFP